MSQEVRVEYKDYKVVDLSKIVFESVFGDSMAYKNLENFFMDRYGKNNLAVEKDINIFDFTNRTAFQISLISKINQVIIDYLLSLYMNEKSNATNIKTINQVLENNQTLCYHLYEKMLDEIYPSRLNECSYLVMKDFSDLKDIVNSQEYKEKLEKLQNFNLIECIEVSIEPEIEKEKQVLVNDQDQGIRTVDDFKIICDNKQIFEQIIKTSETLIDELTVEISYDGISIRTMDPSHVVLLDIFIPSSEFNSYNVSKLFKIGLRTTELLKILKQFESKDTFVIEYKNDQLTISDNIDFKVKIKTIEPYSSSTPLPKLNLNTEVVFSKKHTDILAKRSEILEYITLIAENNTLRMESKTDDGDFTQKFNDLELLDIKEDMEKATYSIDYIVEFLKSFTVVKFDKVNMKFSSKMPSVWTVNLGQGKVNLYLAPRVQD